MAYRAPRRDRNLGWSPLPKNLGYGTLLGTHFSGGMSEVTPFVPSLEISLDPAVKSYNLDPAHKKPNSSDLAQGAKPV